MTSLAQAIEQIRPELANVTSPTKQRIRCLWASAKQARRLAEDKVVADTLIALAIETNLIDRAGCWTGADVAEHRRSHGAQDVAHVISWALRGWNPFEKGQLS
jgi:hypothetical protein